MVKPLLDRCLRNALPLPLVLVAMLMLPGFAQAQGISPHGTGATATCAPGCAAAFRVWPGPGLIGGRPMLIVAAWTRLTGSLLGPSYWRVPVATEPFEEGLEAYERGDYATALLVWRPLAEQGDARAQNNLGAMYAHGRGVAQNEAEATRWYRMAADQGNAHAQNNLGLMYFNGAGVPQSAENAYVWFAVASAQDYAPAAHNRDTIAGLMTPAQLSEAQRLVRERTAP